MKPDPAMTNTNDVDLKQGQHVHLGMQFQH